ncbi:MAG: metal-sensitive transcriptional regulator [Thermoanaerobaculia bacterium]|nr:metal-sensitive transcriptional regulator [Thermoanaerobaculia bacterium]
MTTIPAAGTLSEADRKALIDRLARVEGQLRGVQRMIAEERDCEAIAQQLSAARGALAKAFTELIACAIEHRMVEEPPAELHDRLSGILGLLTRYG